MKLRLLTVGALTFASACATVPSTEGNGEVSPAIKAVPVLSENAAAAASDEPYHPPAKRVGPFAAYADAQLSSPAALKPTPVLESDGNPDLNGAWGPIPSPAGRGGLRRGGTFEPDQAALQRASGWNKPIYKPEFWDQVRSLDYGLATGDPGYGCLPTGTPRQNVPAKVVQTDKEVVLIYNGLRTRVVPLGAGEPTDADMDMSTYDGISYGRWDDDVLVIESVGFTSNTWLQWQGYFHTDYMTVTERLWRKGDVLFYNFTVDDPDVLLEPWTQDTIAVQLIPSTSYRVQEQAPCEILPAGGDPYLRG